MTRFSIGSKVFLGAAVEIVSHLAYSLAAVHAAMIIFQLDGIDDPSSLTQKRKRHLLFSVSCKRLCYFEVTS